MDTHWKYVTESAIALQNSLDLQTAEVLGTGDHQGFGGRFY